MSIVIHTIKAKDKGILARDELGWPYGDALIAIRKWTKSSQETGESKDGDEDYTLSYDVEAVVYTANFYGSEEVQREGKKSRPLYNLDDTESLDKFIADLKTEEVIQILNSGIPSKEMTFEIIESDLRRRFPEPA